MLPFVLSRDVKTVQIFVDDGKKISFVRFDLLQSTMVI